MYWEQGGMPSGYNVDCIKEWIRINCEDIGGTWIDISFYSNYCKDADRWGNWKIISMNVNPTCDTATEEIFGY